VKELEESLSSMDEGAKETKAELKILKRDKYELFSEKL